MAIRQNFPGTNEMTFFDVITRGLKRRPIRTGLTLLGIAVGIAAVVALIGLSRGLVTSWTAVKELLPKLNSGTVGGGAVGSGAESPRTLRGRLRRAPSGAGNRCDPGAHG